MACRRQGIFNAAVYGEECLDRHLRVDLIRPLTVALTGFSKLVQSTISFTLFLGGSGLFRSFLDISVISSPVEVHLYRIEALVHSFDYCRLS